MPAHLPGEITTQAGPKLALSSASVRERCNAQPRVTTPSRKECQLRDGKHTTDPGLRSFTDMGGPWMRAANEIYPDALPDVLSDRIPPARTETSFLCPYCVTAGPSEALSAPSPSAA